MCTTKIEKTTYWKDFSEANEIGKKDETYSNLRNPSLNMRNHKLRKTSFVKLSSHVK
jgi:hypothetical protein